jgi:uncharacterized protein involved in outer membrane biogenesis
MNVEMRDLRLANVSGGSTPEMVTIERATAEVDLLSLIVGPMTVRRLALDGLRIVLERYAEGVGNWRLGDAATKPRSPNQNDPGGRANFPTLLDATLHGGEISYRTGSGATLRTELANVAIHADGGERPISLAGEGAYNGSPVSLRATTASFAKLHNPAVPLAMELTLATPESGLRFKGAATDPLHLDGLDGTLDLDTRKLGELLAIFQVHTGLSLPMRFSGKLLRTGDQWRLINTTGTLSAARFNGMLELTEGKRVGPQRVDPDRLSFELAFDKLDLNELMSRAGMTGSKSHSSDTLPAIDKDPGVVGEARVSAKQIVYGATEVSDVTAHGMVTPGKITLTDTRFAVVGAKADLSVAMEPASRGTSVAVAARFEGADIGQLARMLGMGRPPLEGRLSARATLTTSGLSIPEALKASRGAAVLSMNGGAVSRQLMQMAAADLRALFGGGKGSARITCLLAIADLQGLAGPLAPIRLATSEGTIEGFGQIDLLKRWLDVTIRTEPSTTSAVALDTPIRIHGRFDNPSVLPATGTFDRARLTGSYALNRLPPDLQQSARASPCMR